MRSKRKKENKKNKKNKRNTMNIKNNLIYIYRYNRYMMLQFNSQINNGENNNVSGNICPCENCNPTGGTKMIRRTTSNISF